MGRNRNYPEHAVKFFLIWSNFEVPKVFLIKFQIIFGGKKSGSIEIYDLIWKRSNF